MIISIVVLYRIVVDWTVHSTHSTYTHGDCDYIVLLHVCISIKL